MNLPFVQVTRFRLSLVGNFSNLAPPPPLSRNCYIRRCRAANVSFCDIFQLKYERNFDIIVISFSSSNDKCLQVDYIYSRSYDI